MLVTSIFFFSHYVFYQHFFFFSHNAFYPIWYKFHHLATIYLSSANAFNLDHSAILSLCKELNSAREGLIADTIGLYSSGFMQFKASMSGCNKTVFHYTTVSGCLIKRVIDIHLAFVLDLCPESKASISFFFSDWDFVAFLKFEKKKKITSKYISMMCRVSFPNTARVHWLI